MSTDSGGNVTPAWNLSDKTIVRHNIGPKPVNPTNNDITASASVQATYPLGIPGSQKSASNGLEPSVPTAFFIRTLKSLVEKVLARLEGEFLGPSVPRPVVRESLIRLRQVFVELQKFLPEETAPNLPKEIIRILKRIPLEIRELAYFIEVLPEEKEAIKVKIPLTPYEQEILEKFEKFQKKFPAFLKAFARVLPALEEKIPEEIKPLMKETLKEPIIQAFLPKQEPIPTKHLPSIPPFVPTGKEEKSQETIPFQKAPLERIRAVYPHFVPARPVLPTVARPFIERPLREIPIIPRAQVPLLERPAPFNPFFSTEIPFAFIVPYTPVNIIHTNFATVRPLGKTPVTEEGIEPDDEDIKKLVQLLAHVPDGETWYGDPFQEGAQDEQPLRKLFLDRFSIGVYLVTNEQFAAYLNECSRKKTIKINEKGLVVSLSGEVICQLKTNNNVSDIESEVNKRYLAFKATTGKGSYPVVCVSYFGAKSFCEAGGFRLPTEIEWEKAAGLKMDEQNNPAYKFRYGFSSDMADRSLANYQADSIAESLFQGHSTPVGFYNGQKAFIKEGESFQTANAVSFFGCYDMSGNVSEWTETGDLVNKIIKGGSFENQSKDIRVSTRHFVSVYEMKDTIGFRVVLA